jgi:hypothetical protein
MAVGTPRGELRKADLEKTTAAGDEARDARFVLSSAAMVDSREASDPRQDKVRIGNHTNSQIQLR